MNNVKYQPCKAISVITLVGILFHAPGLCAEERLPASEALSDGTKEFLSDPARTGSLLGSILAGAALANPFAPLVGSVAGFMIGKSSAFTNKDGTEARRQAYINRSLFSENDTAVSNLNGLAGKAVEVSERLTHMGLPSETVAGYQSERGKQIVIVELPDEGVANAQSKKTEHALTLGLTGEVETVGSDLQKQLARACSNSQGNKSISSSCYYFSQ